MAWAMWLSVPLGAPVLVALWSWLRARPRRAPTTTEAIQAHRAYLEALVAPPGNISSATGS